MCVNILFSFFFFVFCHPTTLPLVVSVWVLRLPFPEVRTHGIETQLHGPAQILIRLFGVCPECRKVTWSACTDLRKGFGVYGCGWVGGEAFLKKNTPRTECPSRTPSSLQRSSQARWCLHRSRGCRCARLCPLCRGISWLLSGPLQGLQPVVVWCGGS